MKYTYYISTDDKVSWVQFYPNSKNKLSAEVEANELFARLKIDELRIDARRNATVYTALASGFVNTAMFGMYIYFKIKVSGTDRYYFKCSFNDGKLDKQNKVFSCSPTPDDNYQLVIDTQDADRNIASSFSGASVKIHTAPSVNFVNVNIETYNDTGGAITYLDTTNSSTTARMAFARTVSVGDKVTIIITNYAPVTGEDPTIHIANAALATISNTAAVADGRMTLTYTGTAPAYLVLTIDSTVGDAEGAFNYVIFDYGVLSIASNPLKTLINTYLGVSFMKTGLTCRSTFFFNDVLPSEAPAAISTYLTSNPTHNYVTEAANKLNGIRLSRVDAIATTDVDEHMLSFKELMDILKYKIRAYWYIDSGGFFRIEHEQYFRGLASQLNITTLFKPEVDASEFRYDKSNSYSLIQYKEENQGSEDFIAAPIVYDIVKTSNKTRDISVPDLTTDIQYVIDNVATANPKGYFLLITETIGLTDVTIIDETSTAGVYHQNWHLSWYNIFQTYFDYFGEADTADINDGTTLTFTHRKEILKQEGVKFYTSTILNPLYPVTTTSGVGWIGKMELDLESGFYTIDFEFDPY